MKIKWKKLDHYDESLGLPCYETPGSAGADLKACLGIGERLVIKPGSRVLIPTGLAIEIEYGHEVQIRPRSGLSLKTGLLVVNSPGTIDSDYRGELKIILGNLGNRDEIIEHGDRIAQMVVASVVQAEFEVVADLSQTQRGEGGFGSTGKK